MIQGEERLMSCWIQGCSVKRIWIVVTIFQILIKVDMSFRPIMEAWRSPGPRPIWGYNSMLKLLILSDEHHCLSRIKVFMYLSPTSLDSPKLVFLQIWVILTILIFRFFPKDMVAWLNLAKKTLQTNNQSIN